jgi:hypothetical protein
MTDLKEVSGTVNTRPIDAETRGAFRLTQTAYGRPPEYFFILLIRKVLGSRSTASYRRRNKIAFDTKGQ